MRTASPAAALAKTQAARVGSTMITLGAALPHNCAPDVMIAAGLDVGNAA